MAEIFLSIINMSVSASWVLLAVLVLRLLLKKAPKWITVILWGVVAVRLICPFSIESIFSLIPSAETVSPGIMTERVPTINTGIPIINSALNPVIGESFTPAPGASANPLQIWIPILASVWLAGVAVLLAYVLISYIRVKRRIGTAVLCRDNIWQSENVVSPFVLGLIKPQIYLPFSMREQDMAYVLAHEQAHIRRKDHLWKPVGFLLLALHWFNPLMWLGYVLLCRDIELACDEKVIKELDHDARADYSEALLTCSVNRRLIAACPLAFGEVGVKERVKSVLNYKKPAFWIIIAAVVICIVVAVCFLTNPPQKPDDPAPGNEIFTEYEGVYLRVDTVEINTDGHRVFNLVMYNDTDERVTYGLDYFIQRKDGDEWVGVATGDLIFVSVAYRLNPGKMEQLSYSTEKFDISKHGTYRLVVPFSIDEGNGYKDYKTWIEFRAGDVPTVESLKNKYPQFFDLNTESGLTVYKNYLTNTWYLYSTGTEDRSVFDTEGASMLEMRMIVESYKLDRERIYFDFNVKFSASETNKKILEELKTKFWSISLPIEFFPYYDRATFDVDNDGINEICTMRYGLTSGVFTFVFEACEVGNQDIKYNSRLYSPVFDLSFKKGADGIMRVQGTTPSNEIHLFDISIKDGHIHLTENGVPIGELQIGN